MLTTVLAHGSAPTVLAHGAAPVTPATLWGDWHLDPFLLAGIVVLAWLYRRGGGRAPDAGRREPAHARAWRARAFAGALVAVVLALVSPLEALASALASAHMVQHVFLVLIAAPLLAFAAPTDRLLRGAPAGLARAAARWRDRPGPATWALRWLRRPAAAWLLHAGAFWIWHGARPYTAALEHDLVHIAEHVTFFATALLFWTVVASTRQRHGPSAGLGVMLVFTMTLQSVFLSVLLTFAGSPWYAGYEQTTRAFGLTPLADQQLAGVILWVPAGAIYLTAGIVLVARWLREDEPEVRTAGAS